MDRTTHRTGNGTEYLTLRIVDGDPAATLPPGAAVVVDWRDRRLIHDRCYLVRDRGNATFVRYCQSIGGFRTNDETRTPLARPVDIVGRVVSVIRPL